MKIKTGEHPLITRLLSFTLAFSIILISVLVPAVMPVPVYAAVSSNTLKAFLIALSMNMGVANVDPASISYMNNNAVLNAPLTTEYFGDGGIYDDANAINQALSSNEGVARWTAGYSNNAAQVKVAQQYISSSGGNPSDLANLGEASAGENILSSVKHYIQYYGETGIEDIKPALGGKTITDALNATAVCAAMSNYAYNFDQYMAYANQANLTQEERDELWDQGLVFADQNQIEDYLQNRNKTICNGADINTPQSTVNNMYAGGSYGQLITGNGRYRYDCYSNANQYLVKWNQSNSSYQYHCFSQYSGSCKFTYNGGSATTKSLRSSGNYYYTQLVAITSNFDQVSDFGFYDLGTRSGYSDALSYFFGNIEDFDTEKKSPSLIGSQGQLSGTATQDPITNNYNFNINVNPIANYNTYNYGLPSDEDINSFQNSIQTGIQQGLTQEELGAIFLNFANSFRSEVTIPQPTLEPMPTFVPPQPTGVPVTPIPPEDEEELPKAMVPAGLITKFPFSIPWDVVYAIKHFGTEDRNAPVLDADIDLGPAGVHHVHIDFSDYDDVAVLLRSLQLLVFIVLLAKATKHLMWS